MFKLVARLVAVGWQLWMALVFGGVLFKLELVVLTRMAVVRRLCELGRWLVAVSVWSIGVWVIGMG